MLQVKYNILNKYYSYILLYIFFFWITLSACPAGQDQAGSYHCVTQYENGSINWTTGKITAVGKAFPDGKMQTSNEWIQGAARADANRGVIKILKGLKLSTAQRVEEYAAQSDIILAGIEKTARDAVILKQYYTSALAVEMTIETSIFGGFLQLVLPEDIRQIHKISPDTLLKKMDMNTDGNTNGLSTGLIIDARGLEFEPVLNPAIVSEQGHDMYSSVFISREFAVQKGVCKYYCSMEQALNDRRVGNNPLIFKGLRKEGKENTSIVINMADYRLLEKKPERHVFLKECRVIIVMD
ncbi:MAG: hypothetical protein L3J69_07030 [Desulfobacula sp.]|nr:hypothetical protein [Desulfobacula sp.]